MATTPKTAPASELVDPFGAPEGYSWKDKKIMYADKDEHIFKKSVFTIVDVIFEEEQGYKGADRWVVVALFKDGSYEAISFDRNEKRDEVMRAAQQWIKAYGPMESKVLRKSKDAIYINGAL